MIGGLVAGPDVSAYQSANPDLSGSEFCFVKHTEGTGYRNPLYQLQVLWAREHGLVVGHYLFLDAYRNPLDQTRLFAESLLLEEGDLIALDWEQAGSTQEDRDAALRSLKQMFPTHKVGLYCNLNFWRHIDTESNAGDFLWIADPSSHAGHPAVQHPWHFHQYGISGGMDRNVANSHDPAIFRIWCLEKAHLKPTAAPAPVHTPAPAQTTKENTMTEMTPETPGTVPTSTDPAPAPAPVVPETPTPAPAAEVVPAVDPSPAPPTPEVAASTPEPIATTPDSTAGVATTPDPARAASPEALPAPHPIDELRALVAELEAKASALISAADLKKAVDIFISALELAWIK